MCSPTLGNIWDEDVLLNKNFPENFELTDVTLIYKKKGKTFVGNYRPLSILPADSKILERKMQKQIADYIGKFLSAFLCGYRKGLNTMYVLLSLIEWWKLCLDKQGFARALLMDLSKSVNTINHELIIAKLHVYGISIDALELSYFKKFHKDWFLVPCSLKFTSMIYFFALNEIDICDFADDITLIGNRYLKSVLEKIRIQF